MESQKKGIKSSSLLKPADGPEKFRVVIDIDKVGFITPSFDTCKEAEKYMKQILELEQKYPMDDLIAAFYSRFASYQINGTEIYLGKCLLGSSNGYFSVSVIQIQDHPHNIKQFIRERENHSIVFEWDEIPDDYFDVFTEVSFIAN